VFETTLLSMETLMHDTYDSGAQAEADRRQQQAMLTALNASGRALRRDNCGAWCISGKAGSIHTSGDGRSWVVFVACRSPQHWTWTKKRLSFCQMTQDGDAEGCLRLLDLPTPEQAKSIRSALGLPKRREVSAGVQERLKAFSFQRRPRSEPILEPNITLGDRPGTPDTYLDQMPILAAEPAK
jgi:hypothetical protein